VFDLQDMWVVMVLFDLLLLTKRKDLIFLMLVFDKVSVRLNYFVFIFIRKSTMKNTLKQTVIWLILSVLKIRLLYFWLLLSMYYTSHFIDASIF